MSSHISLQPMSQDQIKRVQGSERSRPGLPPELLQDISRRLQFICLLMAAYSLLSAATNFAASANPLTFSIGIAVRVGMSLAVYLVARRGNLSALRLIDLGLGYEVFLAAALALTTVSTTWGTGARSTLLWSTVHVLVMIYPVVVPSLTGRALTAAILSSATVPAALVLYVATGVVPNPGTAAFLRLLAQSVIAVGIAVGVSRLLYRLGEQLTQARALGSYHLSEKVGAGGMGEVWKATHQFLARPAAVKLVRRDQTGESDEQGMTAVLQRFEREAQATAALQSPHTVSVYDFGIARDGTFYYVMELLEGLDLATLIRRDGPQPPERVVHILRQACHSLFEAHERGLIHRDIKPANIFLCRYATDLDFVKVLDFGLAKNLGNPSRAEFQVTQMSMIAGTPGFIAPEAAAGVGGIDGRADLYALGCVAYWLLSGQEVFDGPTPMSVLVAHLKEAPDRLSTRATQPIPAGLDAIIMACLEKDPVKRPQTAHELSTMLAGLGIESQWTPERAALWWADYHGKTAPSAPTMDLSEAATRRLEVQGK
jgi:serine/threonine-protein kinase